MLMRRLAHDIAKDLAAFSGAARAWNRLGLGWMAEVRGEFLVRENSADTVEEQASAPAPPRQVRITPVIDKLCPASADASIDCWAVAVVNQIVVVGGLKQESLFRAEPPPGVLDNLSPAGDVLAGKYAISVDWRPTDPQAIRR
jgi:hypothetical protein